MRKVWEFLKKVGRWIWVFFLLILVGFVYIVVRIFKYRSDSGSDLLDEAIEERKKRQEELEKELIKLKERGEEIEKKEYFDNADDAIDKLNDVLKRLQDNKK